MFRGTVKQTRTKQKGGVRGLGVWGEEAGLGRRKDGARGATHTVKATKGLRIGGGGLWRILPGVARSILLVPIRVSLVEGRIIGG